MRPTPIMGPIIAQTGVAAKDDPWPPIWFALARMEWQTLAIVPAHADTSTDAVAQTLTEVGRRFGETAVRAIDAQRIADSGVRDLLVLLAQRRAAGERTIVALSSPLEYHAAIPLARAADGAILVVTLGETRMRDARKLIDGIGRDAFIGSITVDPASGTIVR
jgi:hypothetical protein